MLSLSNSQQVALWNIGVPAATQAGGEGWGLVRAVEVALLEWAGVQLGLLGAWVGRLLAGEDWRPVTQPQGCSR